MLIPNTFLSIFTLPGTEEIWVRVAGWLICVLGFYYVVGGYQDIGEFIRITIPGRVGVFGFHAVVVILGLIKPVALALSTFSVRYGRQPPCEGRKTHH